MKCGTTKCIYCSNLFDPNAGEGDHVLPRGFGEFDGAIIFRGACISCNNNLSPLEEELLRTAPEAIFRRFAGATQNRRGKATGWQAASRIPAPQFVVRHLDHDELVDSDPALPNQVRPVDQLVVSLANGQTFRIRVFPSMTVHALRRRLDQLGIKDADILKSHWNSQENNANKIASLIKDLWPQQKHGNFPITPAGTHCVRVRAECRFTHKYYRAIAKIAFHYLLSKTRCGFTGHEACFEALRKFILEGGDHQQFFSAEKPLIALPFGPRPDGTFALPARWLHLLCCFESPSSVVVPIYTIFGPHRHPSPHFVTLFHRPSQVFVPSHRYGHAYVYGDPKLGDTRINFVERIALDILSN